MQDQEHSLQMDEKTQRLLVVLSLPSDQLPRKLCILQRQASPVGLGSNLIKQDFNTLTANKCMICNYCWIIRIFVSFTPQCPFWIQSIQFWIAIWKTVSMHHSLPPCNGHLVKKQMAKMKENQVWFLLQSSTSVFRCKWEYIPRQQNMAEKYSSANHSKLFWFYLHRKCIY